MTGTGTEVGKTVVAAAIARTLHAAGESVAVFKPAESGLDDCAASGRPPDHELLRIAAASGQADDEISPYRYGPPVSPHLGAELAGEPISPDRLREAARAAAAAADAIVCEGVGGFCVPLTLGYLVRDLARDLSLPVVVAAHPGLGTINHTLLTVEAVRAAGLEVMAVVLTPWPTRPSPVEASNRSSLGLLSGTEILTLEQLALDDPEGWPALRPGDL